MDSKSGSYEAVRGLEGADTTRSLSWSLRYPILLEFERYPLPGKTASIRVVQEFLEHYSRTLVSEQFATLPESSEVWGGGAL